METTHSAEAAEKKGLPSGWTASRNKGGRWTYIAPDGEEFSSLASAKTAAASQKPPRVSESPTARPGAAGIDRSTGALARAADPVQRAKAAAAAAQAEAILPSTGDDGLSQYERERLGRIARNEAFMQSLGLGGGLAGGTPGGKRAAASQRGVPRKKVKKAPAGPARRSPRLEEEKTGKKASEPLAALSYSTAEAKPERERLTGDHAYRVDGFDSAPSNSPFAAKQAESAAARVKALKASGADAEAIEEAEADQKACDAEAAEALAAVTAEDAEERADAARLVARVAGAASGTRKALSEARYATSLQQMRIRDVDIAKVTQARTYALAWQPRSDRLLIASGDVNGQLGLWDVDEADAEKCCWSLSRAHSRPVTALYWDGGSVISGGYDSLVRKCALDHAPLVSTVVADYYDDDVDDLTHFCLQGDVVWGAHKCGGVSRFDSRAGSPTSKKLIIDAHGRKTAHIGVRPGHEFHLTTSSNDGSVVVWDVRKLKPKKPTEVWAYEHAKSVHGFCWSADGKTLASCSYDDTVGFHDVDADKTVSVRHDNRTGRYLTPFKPTMDPHAPFAAVIMGSMGRPRCVDVLRAKAPNTLIKLNDRDNVFHAVTSLHDVHPYAHVIAGANNSGRLSIWRPVC